MLLSGYTGSEPRLLAGPLDTALPWVHATTHLREVKSEWLAGLGAQGFSNLKDLIKIQMRVHMSEEEPKIPHFLQAPPQGCQLSGFVWHWGVPRAWDFQSKTGNVLGKPGQVGHLGTSWRRCCWPHFEKKNCRPSRSGVRIVFKCDKNVEIGAWHHLFYTLKRPLWLLRGKQTKRGNRSWETNKGVAMIHAGTSGGPEDGERGMFWREADMDGERKQRAKDES